jgi:hypothetical protein
VAFERVDCDSPVLFRSGRLATVSRFLGLASGLAAGVAWTGGDTVSAAATVADGIGEGGAASAAVTRGDGFGVGGTSFAAEAAVGGLGRVGALPTAN